jgi:hypothetical protein
MAARSRTAQWSRGSAGVPRRTVIRPGGLDGAAFPDAIGVRPSPVRMPMGGFTCDMVRSYLPPRLTLQSAPARVTMGSRRGGFNRRSRRRFTALPCVLLMPGGCLDSIR